MIVFLFPGQGSQQAKMGQSWVDHPSFDMVYEACKLLDRDLAALLLSTTEEDLTATHNTQLAVFLLSLVILDAVESTGLQPGLLAGHSLGEYSALVASGALTVESGLSLVLKRAEAMQQASKEGNQKMAALLGINYEKATFATRCTFNCWVANDNSFEQVVIAGNATDVDKATEHARSLGAKKVIELKVGGAFHTPYMASAMDKLKDALYQTEFKELDTPVIANLDAQPHQDNKEWPNLLLYQLTNVVRWRESMNYIAKQQPSVVVELGPGNVLATLAKKFFKNEPTEVLAVNSPNDISLLLKALTQKETKPFDNLSAEAPAISDKIVVAPTNGIFQPTEDLALVIQSPASNFHNRLSTTSLINVGDTLGTIAECEVVSPFSGLLKAFLVTPGERVTKGQPLAWISES